MPFYIYIIIILLLTTAMHSTQPHQPTQNKHYLHLFSDCLDQFDTTNVAVFLPVRIPHIHFDLKFF